MNPSKHLVVTRKQWTFTSNTLKGKIGIWTLIGDEVVEDADVVVVAEDVVVDVMATVWIRLNPNLLVDSEMPRHLL